MSEPSAVASHAATVDWNIVAAALATFFGTLCVTIWGFVTGKRKITERLQGRDGNEGVNSAAILDNTTLVQHVLIQREIRDHMLLNTHALTALCSALEDNTRAADNLARKLDGYIS